MPAQQPPIQVVHLFPVLESELIALLQSLSPADWQKSTLAKQWQVRDIVAHLLDTSLRALSVADGHLGDPPKAIDSYQELVDYLNQLNADWVTAMRRVSPQQLIFLLRRLQQPFCELMAFMPLFEPAMFPVAWAGEQTSMNWFHIAREYTERWHHQMQIREAVGKPGKLMEKELFYPCMATCMYGLPFTLRYVTPANNCTVRVTIAGDAGGSWFVSYQNGKWQLADHPDREMDAIVELEPAIAWKLFTKGITPAQAQPFAKTAGDEKLWKAVLGMVSVMA